MLRGNSTFFKVGVSLNVGASNLGDGIVGVVVVRIFRGTLLSTVAPAAVGVRILLESVVEFVSVDNFKLESVVSLYVLFFDAGDRKGVVVTCGSHVGYRSPFLLESLLTSGWCWCWRWPCLLRT